MDEIELFAALRPETGGNLTGQRERARDRLASAMSNSAAHAGVRRAPWRLSPLNPSARAAFAVSGAALAVGGAVVLPIVLRPGQTGSLVTSAWAVQPRQDGTVKVTIKDASDPAGLERALRSAGVRAIVVPNRAVAAKKAANSSLISCGYTTNGNLFEPAAIQRAVVTLPRSAGGAARAPEVIALIHPAAMPAGSVLFIVDTFSVAPNGDRVLTVTPPAVLRSDQTPRCASPHRGPVPQPTAFPTPSPSPSGPTPEPSGRPSASPTPVPTGSSSPFPTGSPTPRPTRSSSPRPTPSPTPTHSPGVTPSPTPTHSPGFPSPSPSTSSSPSR